MYTGSERDVPSERIQSEFVFDRDPSKGWDHPTEDRSEAEEQESSKEAMSDGGFQYERFFEGEAEDFYEIASEYQAVSIADYGEDLVTVRGHEKPEFDEFVREIRQSLGKEFTESELERSDEHPDPNETVSKNQSCRETVADGGEIQYKGKSYSGLPDIAGTDTREPEAEESDVPYMDLL